MTINLNYETVDACQPRSCSTSSIATKLRTFSARANLRRRGGKLSDTSRESNHFIAHRLVDWLRHLFLSSMADTRCDQTKPNENLFAVRHIENRFSKKSWRYWLVWHSNQNKQGTAWCAHMWINLSGRKLGCKESILSSKIFLWLVGIDGDLMDGAELFWDNFQKAG